MDFPVGWFQRPDGGIYNAGVVGVSSALGEKFNKISEAGELGTCTSSFVRARGLVPRCDISESSRFAAVMFGKTFECSHESDIWG